MRPGVFAAWVVCGLLVGTASPALAELPSGRGAVLPLQDRVGDAELARLAEDTLVRQMAAHGEVVGPEGAREVLRELRMRDATNEAPERLSRLAERLGVDWYFVATLHEARRGRLPSRDDGRAADARDSGQTPQVILSARVFERDAEALTWAGFRAATGRDTERAFGIGQVETLDELLENALRDLVDAASDPGDSRARARLRPEPHGFLRPANVPAPPERVAVVPMDSVAELAPRASSEVVTAALLAALDDFGFEVLLPGWVQAIRYRSGETQYGATRRAEWEALAREAGARWVATGTVETYRGGYGTVPDPWVGFSVRLLDATDGRIDWIAGMERTGSDTGIAFDRGRIYSTGDLTYEMMRALFAAMQRGAASERRSEDV